MPLTQRLVNSVNGLGQRLKQHLSTTLKDIVMRMDLGIVGWTAKCWGRKNGMGWMKFFMRGMKQKSWQDIWKIPWFGIDCLFIIKDDI